MAYRIAAPRTASGWFTLIFISAWIAVVILPLFVVSTFSFFSMKQYQLNFEPTLSTWQALYSTGRWQVVLRTLQFAVAVTAMELLLAFPFALWLAKGCRSHRLRAVFVTLLTIPFFLDASSRIIVWRSILGTNGAINTLLLNLGIIDQPLTWLLYSPFSVQFGMLGSYFPSMVFPIFLVMTLIDDDLLKASADLGASDRQTLVNIILPLSLPGIVGGIVFTFVPLMAAWVEPQLLGGSNVNLLGQSIQSALTNLNYPVASALSTIVILLLVVMLVTLSVSLRGRFKLASIFQSHGQ